jgi:hypothetical protein
MSEILKLEKSKGKELKPGQTDKDLTDSGSIIACMVKGKHHNLLIVSI